MLNYEEMEYHPTAERIVKILQDKTQNEHALFFRVLVGYYFSVAASMMRCSIVSEDRGEIPINTYAIALAPSGEGKTMSSNVIENDILGQFQDRFIKETFPLLAESNLPKLAVERARRKNKDPDEELLLVEREFDLLGNLLFSFDSATPAALKQMRHKLLMANAGAGNLIIDEVGSNLIGNMDAFDTFLELYDVGLIKEKLIKNTQESIRNEEIVGRTPFNMLAFGTPASLLNGSKEEEEFYALLERGYARRSFIGYIMGSRKPTTRTAEEIYDLYTSKDSEDFLEEISEKLYNLADIINVNKKLVMSKETSLLLINYQLDCERRAYEYTEYEAVKKTEMSHRYFKVLKLAGAYAFIDDSPELTKEHLRHAIKLAEETGKSFIRLLTRDRNYVKLAKYFAAVKRDVTQPDLVEDLPFYRGSMAAKNEMLNLAIAWGYKNNVIIKKTFSDGVEFLRGESLKDTNLSNVRVSYSTHMAYNYQNESPAFEDLHLMTQAEGIHWTSHHLRGGHRSEDNAIPGFSLVVLDIDNGTSLQAARTFLKEYTYHIYTTKRHTPEHNRFRIIMPINYELELDADDYKEFMRNVYEWLPFDVDESTDQRARKWLSHKGHYEYNDGIKLDALPFIPKTSKNEERKELLHSQQSLDNLERWVTNNIGDGNRNNMLLRYAMMLVDAGFDFNTISQKVIGLNEKIADKLDEAEILSTIMTSVSKAINKRDI